MHRILSLLITALLSLFLASAALAEGSGTKVQGFYLLTDYPSVTLRPGSTSTVSLELDNRGMAPARMALHVDGVPKGWKATLLGGGQPVGAAMPGTDSNVSLQLQVKVPADASKQTHTLTVLADGDGQKLSLPIDVALADQLPSKLSLEAKLPELKGGPSSSFDYQVTIKNDSGKDLLVSMNAQAPKYFDTTFTESYGSQQLSSVPIKAGASKDIKLSVRPPNIVKPGNYPITVTVAAGDTTATTKLKLDIVGQPHLTLAGRNGLMSTGAEAGKASSFPVVLTNDGSAPAQNIKLSATAPSGWRVDFQPKTVEQIPPGQHTEVQAHITPSDKSLAGDYMVNLQSASQGQSASGDLRVSVTTSSLWGIIGAVLIAIAILILVGAVARYGRR